MLVRSAFLTIENEELLILGKDHGEEDSDRTSLISVNGCNCAKFRESLREGRAVPHHHIQINRQNLGCFKMKCFVCERKCDAESLFFLWPELSYHWLESHTCVLQAKLASSSLSANRALATVLCAFGRPHLPKVLWRRQFFLTC